MVYKLRFPAFLLGLMSVLVLAAPSLDGAEPTHQARLTHVDVLQIVSQAVKLTSNYMGQVTPLRTSRLSAQVDGQLGEVPVSVGEGVKKGQLLAAMDTTRLSLTYRLALSNHELAKAEFQREEKLFQKHLTSSAKLTAQKNRMEVSYYQMKLNQTDLDHSQIKAPFAGVVSVKSAELGEYVKKGNQLFELMDLSKVKVKVHIPEREIGFARIGKVVRVTVDALGGKLFSGVISSVSLQADQKSRSFAVQVTVKNPQQEMFSGMLARVKMVTENLVAQVLIPRDTVLEDEQGSYVYITEASVIKKRPITLGHAVGEKVQVLSGLKAGQSLVVVGQQMVNHNEPVEINHSKLQAAMNP